jgi:pimeloyl-ACP methyl ester carboxylesterase
MALRFALPFVDAAQLLDAPRTPGPVARARLRHGSADLHAGVLAQLARCVAVGHLCDRTGRVDVVASLDASVPALLLVAEDDTRCTHSQVQRAARALGTEAITVPGGHLDPLTAEDVRTAACDALLGWMSGLHDRCRAP